MAGTGFTINAHRVDPYKNFKFTLSWDDKTVCGVSKVGALKRTTEVVTHRSGGENSVDHNSAGRTKYEPITIERGITHDPEFENWANRIHAYGGDGLTDLVGGVKEVTLEVYNEKNQVAKRYFIHRCWISEFTAMPELDANANGVAFESMTIQNEGWERDTELAEPDEAE